MPAVEPGPCAAVVSAVGALLTMIYCQYRPRGTVCGACVADRPPPDASGLRGGGGGGVKGPRGRAVCAPPAQSVGKSSRAWAVSGCVAGMPGPVEHRRSSDGPQRCWGWFPMVSGSRASL